MSVNQNHYSYSMICAGYSAFYLLTMFCISHIAVVNESYWSVP